MAPFRASRLSTFTLLFALSLTGSIQAVGPVSASEPGSDLDALAYGAPADPAKPTPRRPRRSAPPNPATTDLPVPVVVAASPVTTRPPSFEENSPGLLAVLGFDNRRFAAPIPQSALPPLDARASIVAAPPAPPPPPAALEENSPGLLAAVGLDNRIMAPLPRPVPPTEAYARVVVQPVVMPVAVPVSHGGEYRLGAGDKLRVVVFGQEGLTNTYSIDAGGAITMPLIGRVTARGHTPGALAEDITARLRKGFIREPSVAVEIESYRPFFILGEVAAPGQYPYVPNMSVEAAVAIAGGFSPRARRDSVTVTHPAEGGLLRAVVPLGTPLSPGDTVLVSERWF